MKTFNIKLYAMRNAYFMLIKKTTEFVGCIQNDYLKERKKEKKKKQIYIA